ncbi:MAG: TIGR04211 family SH3 domain-containing protein [bacterium]|nr:TIGR04211 family SH3 domain-containing protein [bacterium]
MGFTTRLVWLGLVGSLLFTTGSHARTMYISDMFEVVVRSEKEIAGRNIVKILPTGTPLEVINTDDSWATVKLQSGRTAYVLKRYLIARLPYKLTAERLQEEAEQQKARLDTLTEQLTTLRQEHRRLRKASGQQESQLTDTTKKYDQLRQDAAQFLQLKSEYTKLQQTHYDTQQELVKVKKKTQDLKKSSQLLWFLGGAGVMLAGWIIGMMTERLRGRARRQSGYSYQLPQ